MTLLEDDPRELYYQSRGMQIESAINDLIDEYPFGAGLARWGMMSYYFGDKRSEPRGLFAEVQPNAWMLDGGCSAPRALLPGADRDAARRSVAVPLARGPDDRLVGHHVVAANVGTLGLVFTFVPFGTAVGMQFWFLEGVLHGAMADRPRRDE